MSPGRSEHVGRTRVRTRNVIAGDLAEAGQTDWAVLCLRDKRLSIEIHWGGGARCPSSIELHATMVRTAEFDRSIEPADAQAIERWHESYGGPKPPPIDHSGIEYWYLEKGSTVHYCHEGSWLQLTGAD